MNQQTLTSEKDSGNFLHTPASHQANRSMSIVVSFPKNIPSKIESKPDVRFVCSNCSSLDVRMFIDESGEVHTTIKELNSIKLPKIKENIKRPDPILEVPEQEESIIKKRGRGRPKGSKNKLKHIENTSHNIVKEMFETNEEFKARKAEELKLLTN